MKLLTLRVTTLLTLALLTTTALLAQGRTFSRFGQAQAAGRNVIVHVTVGVPPGVDGNRAAGEALRAQGARPFASQEFALTGLVWPATGETTTGGDPVFGMTQKYNGSQDPTQGGLGGGILGTAQSTWNGVTPSTFEFHDGGAGSPCPSLVRECPGPQVLDGSNDVAWVPLNGPFTLAVTWFSIADKEADMAMNTNFPWNTDGSDFDIQTVMLHEEGHVLGLDHTSEIAAVMYATYSGVRRVLHPDDEAGINELYDPANSCSPTSEDSLATCGDSQDNDCDGFIDFDDMDCQLLVCGDGTIQTDFEDCDPNSQGPLTEDCTTLGLGFIGGTLACDANSCQFDTSGCTEPVCTELPKGAECSDDSECCSNKCKGKTGAKTCK